MIRNLNFQLFLVLLLTACFKKMEAPSQFSTGKSAVPKLATDPNATTNLNPGEPVKIVKQKLLTKSQRESIYFAASLEKEAIKLLLKNASFDELTLFSVLSYAIETNSGIKKIAPARLDCSRFRLEADHVSRQEIKVFKSCQRPEVLIATIDLGLSGVSVATEQNRQDLKITYYLKEWAQVVGLSVLLTAKDPVCAITIEDKKLQRFQCENWSRSVAVTATAAEEIRLKTFVFERKQKNQFILKGGRYKDLIERMQINIEVPLEGKIVRWEKEIEVIDEFADKLEPTSTHVAPTLEPIPVKRLQIKGEKSESEENSIQEKTSQDGSGQADGEIGSQDGENGGIPSQPEPQQQRPAGGR